jgi:uncharacterized membrane protein
MFKSTKKTALGHPNQQIKKYNYLIICDLYKNRDDNCRSQEENQLIEAEKKQKEEALQKQKVIIYAVSAGVILILILLFVAIKAYKQKQKANEIIIKQKLEVEEKQKEILDSIHYAKRIQTALLTSEYYIEKNLNRLKK